MAEEGKLELADLRQLHWVYRWTREGRHGQACKIVKRAKDKTCLVEFADGGQMLTDLRSLRRRKMGRHFGMLDVTAANQFALPVGMGITRNEQLAEYYLKAAGIAAVWIDADGCVGAQDAPRIQLEAGRVAYCTARGAHFVLAYRLQLWKQDHQHVTPPSQAALATRLEQLAEEGRVGLTPHAVAIERALAAVATVNQKIEEMKGDGEMKAFNRAFKEARKVDPSIKFFDYLHSRKAALLEKLAMARRT